MRLDRYCTHPGEGADRAAGVRGLVGLDPDIHALEGPRGRASDVTERRREGAVCDAVERVRRARSRRRPRADAEQGEASARTPLRGERDSQEAASYSERTKAIHSVLPRRPEISTRLEEEQSACQRLHR